MKIKKKIPLIDQANKLGFWGGKFGGNYVPETLKKPIEDLEILFNKLKDDKRFIDIFSGKVDEEKFVKETNLESIKVSYQNMNIGDVSFHHGLTFHRAKPNLSKEDRVVHTAIYFADGCTRGDEKFHFSVDRPNIKVGEMIESDVTPIAYPIASMPDRPRTSISDEFMAYKMLGLLPKD